MRRPAFLALALSMISEARSVRQGPRNAPFHLNGFCHLNGLCRLGGLGEDSGCPTEAVEVSGYSLGVRNDRLYIVKTDPATFYRLTNLPAVRLNAAFSPPSALYKSASDVSFGWPSSFLSAGVSFFTTVSFLGAGLVLVFLSSLAIVFLNPDLSERDELSLGRLFGLIRPATR